MLTCSSYLQKAVEDLERLLLPSMQTSNDTTPLQPDARRNSSSHTNPFRIQAPTYYITIAFLLSVLGIVGNVLNILVLNKKRLSSSMDRVERTVNLGLTSLAFSDLLFCIVFFAAIFSEDKVLLTPFDQGISYYFKIYKLSSTWLTVNIAIGRYFAICRPLHAKGFISIKSIRIAIVTIFLFSIFFNLPKFFSLYYDSQDCHQMLYEGGVVGRRKVSSGTPTTQPSFLLKSHLPEYHDYNMAFTGLLEKLENRKNQSPNPDFLESTQRKVKPPQRFIYTLQMDVKCGCRFTTKRITQLHNLFIFSKFYLILTSIFYIFFPLTLLSVCNVCLILALRRSYRMQRLYRANKPNIDNGQRITAVLIVIIMLFIILVIPPDFIIFIKNFISDSNLFKNLRITNLLLLTNFSINFILYFAINTKFRKTFKSLISCCFFCELTRNCPHDSVSQPTSSVTFAHHHAATLQLKSCKSSSLPPKKSLKNMKMFRNSHKQKVSNIEVKITSSPSSSQIMISKLRNSSSKTTNTSESSHKKKSKQFF